MSERQPLIQSNGNVGRRPGNDLSDEPSYVKYSNIALERIKSFFKCIRKTIHIQNLAIVSFAIVASFIVVWHVIDHTRGHHEKLDKDSVFEKYVAVLNKDNLAGNWSYRYTSEVHLAGTNYAMVEWAASKYEEYGFDVEIDEYDVYLSYPESNSLRILDTKDESLVYQPTLVEDEIDEDPTTLGNGKVPTFLGYAGNGNVTGEYIYCNYGSIGDFEHLKAIGVDVKGKIAIVRYGAIFRGLKVKFAQEAGAIGVLLYSDPGDDGEMTEFNGVDVYPEGPGRQPSSVQRGSVQFLSVIPGDPTTPGYGSKKGVERADPFFSTPKIPVLPISYKEVYPILKSLNGHGAKSTDEWKGKLPDIKYNIGPNPNLQMEMYSNQIFNITPTWNIYGTINGTEFPDEIIMIGNHHDAWIKGGAGDPNSGSAVMMELARALGVLYHEHGWRPKRTIKLASWDGEEYGLIGSTEYGESNSKFIQDNVVAYLNLDVACVGDLLSLHASPSLFTLLRSVAKLIEHPGDKVSLYDHFVERGHDRIINLGSGSDYTVFLQHLGIPSLDLGFKGSHSAPVYHYHSNYDSYHWMEKFGDPGFVYHNVMAKYLGLLVLEMSESETLPISVRDEGEMLQEYFKQCIDLIPEHWMNDTVDYNKDYLMGGEYDMLVNNEYIKEISSGTFYLSTDEINKLEHDIDDLNTIQDLIDAIYKQMSQIQELSDLEKDMDNQILKYLERNFMDYAGLNERSWFKHLIFASGRFTGYAGQVYPGLLEALEDDDLMGAKHWLFVYYVALRRVVYSLSV